LSSRLEARLDANPEFKYIREESARLKERIDRNMVTINLAKRQQEADENEARRDKQEKERSERAKQVAERLKDDSFKIYHLTLDNVDAPELVPESAFTREQSTGMKMVSKNDGEDSASDDSKFPYGLEPTKLEAIHILRDFLELSGNPPTTAKTADKAAK